MRFALVSGVVMLGMACASSHAVVSATTPTATAPIEELPPRRPTLSQDEMTRWNHPPRRSERDHTLAVDELPPAFAELSPRDREQWHACHIFFLGDRRTGAAPERYEPRPGAVYRPPTSQHLGFRVTPTDYVAVPEGERRGWLVRNGCPDSLVELADGTHLDMIHP